MRSETGRRTGGANPRIPLISLELLEKGAGDSAGASEREAKSETQQVEL